MARIADALGDRTQDLPATQSEPHEIDKAEVRGSGAIAQGDGAQAAGERSVVAGGNIDTVNTGWQIVNNYYAASDQPLSKEQIAQQVASYLRWLQARTKNIELRGIERAGGASVVLLPLETAYVPLCAKWMRGGADIALNQVLGSGNRLVIIGGPGSGKTTVLMHMAWALASSLLSGQPDPARARLGPLMKPSTPDEQGKSKKPEECKPNELPLPILVPLASFARYRRNLAGNAPARERTLAYFISHHLISKQASSDLPADFFVQLLQDGQDVLLLLDGLDEVANEDERAEVRQSVEELVSGREALRVVVTCRTIAYRAPSPTVAGARRWARISARSPCSRSTRSSTSRRWCAKPMPAFTPTTQPCSPSARTTCWVAFSGWKKNAARDWTNRPRRWWTARSWCGCC